MVISSPLVTSTCMYCMCQAIRQLTWLFTFLSWVFLWAIHYLCPMWAPPVAISQAVTPTSFITLSNGYLAFQTRRSCVCLTTTLPEAAAYTTAVPLQNTGTTMSTLAAVPPMPIWSRGAWLVMPP